MITAYNAWIELLKIILHGGNPVAPRGKRVKELIGMHVVIINSYANIIYHPLRNLNYRFLVAQWLTTLLGLEDRPILDRFNKHLAGYEEDGHGGRYPSYGPKLKQQWLPTLQRIMEDSFTRQAVMSIWEAGAAMRSWGKCTNPNHGDSQEGPCEQPIILGEVPCTLSLQFLLRDNHLHTIATMRSSDAWLGLPYDIFNFTMLANHLAAALSQARRARVYLGSFTLNIGSAHLYEENWAQAEEVVDAMVQGQTIFSPHFPSGYDLPPLRSSLEGTGSTALFQPWLGYAAALGAATSIEALEFLRQLEASHAHLR